MSKYKKTSKLSSEIPDENSIEKMTLSNLGADKLVSKGSNIKEILLFINSNKLEEVANSDGILGSLYSVSIVPKNAKDIKININFYGDKFNVNVDENNPIKVNKWYKSKTNVIDQLNNIYNKL